jgi:type IV pilus assembly protein PilE
MMIKPAAHSKGFTLMELMITVAIVGILAGVAYPSYLDSVHKSRRVDATNGMLQCSGTQERNFTIANTYLDDAAAACTTNDGYYTLVVDNTTAETGCQVSVNGSTRLNCFTVIATPVANSSQADDDVCDTLSLSHTGVRSSEDSAGNDSGDLCWRK